MNRTQRRQMQRAMGNRGSKAKRKGRPRPDRAPQEVGGLKIEAAPEISAAMNDHIARQQARTAGLLVPPSPQEREALQAKGHRVPMSDSGLILPPG